MKRHASPDKTMLTLQLRVFDLVQEHRFHPTRKWRFDWAHVGRKIAIEFEGGTFVAGRHSRGFGFEGDCEKYNEAAILGWRVIRVTAAMVRKGKAFEMISRALSGAPIITVGDHVQVRVRQKLIRPIEWKDGKVTNW